MKAAKPTRQEAFDVLNEFENGVACVLFEYQKGRRGHLVADSEEMKYWEERRQKMLDFLHRLQNTDIWDHITLQYELLRIYLLGKAIVDSVLDGTFYRSVPFVFDGGQDTFYHPYVEFKGVVYRTIEGSDYFDEER